MAKMICANQQCGYKGRPKLRAKGNFFVGCFLLLLCILPGVLYFMYHSGYHWDCPQCGMRVTR